MNSKMILLWIGLLFTLTEIVNGRSSGAPDGACTSMTPGHSGTMAQTSAAPFRVTVSKTTYSGGDSITVTLEQTASDIFKGYLIQARNQNDDIISGFDISGQANSQLLTCNNEANSVTHTEPSDKTSVTFTFTAPTRSRGNITMYATAVQAKATYWVKIPSDVIVDLAPPTGTGVKAAPCILAITLLIVTFKLLL